MVFIKLASQNIRDFMKVVSRNVYFVKKSQKNFATEVWIYTVYNIQCFYTMLCNYCTIYHLINCCDSINWLTSTSLVCGAAKVDTLEISHCAKLLHVWRKPVQFVCVLSTCIIINKAPLLRKWVERKSTKKCYSYVYWYCWIKRLIMRCYNRGWNVELLYRFSTCSTISSGYIILVGLTVRLASPV